MTITNNITVQSYSYKQNRREFEKMNQIKIVQEIYIYNGVAGYMTADGFKAYDNADTVTLCRSIDNMGADVLYITELSNTDAEHDKNIDTVKEIVTAVDIPVMLGGNIKRLEDVKKYLYAGAEAAVLDASKDSNKEMFKEASDRFGITKIAVKSDDVITVYKSADETSAIKLGYAPDFDNAASYIAYCKENADTYGIGFTADKLLNGSENCQITDYIFIKSLLKNDGIAVKEYIATAKFDEFKLNNDGMIPVIVQDYQTNEVLMLGYMNEEAYNHTVETGRMTYYSRSRNELWEKGLTSGHFQYLKSLELDCDKDTLLAKVYQVGAACHTGSRSCFYTNIYKKDYKDNNPHKVFEDVYNVILDRKQNPKEGSYTNYLFDKGIDKILKKVGEEATEIIIAAKNPNPEEIKYEISDFLYHVMVLMAERGVTWEDITTELSRR